MTATGVRVSIHPGSPGSLPERAVEVDVGCSLPVAFGGLRKVLRALGEVAPRVEQELVQAHPAEWNRLFPSSVKGAAELSDLALTPSERRLHRESEQTFWILSVASRLIRRVLAETGRPLVLRHAGQCDLVSLRGLMLAVEASRSDGTPGQLLLTEYSHRRRHAARLFERRHRAYLGALRERTRASMEGPAQEERLQERPLDPAVDLESSYLAQVVDEASSAEHRIAAAILAMRACFFSTNYEGAMLAAEQGLALLDAHGPRLDAGAVQRAWDSLDDVRFVTPAIEVDRESLGDAEELRALLHRQIGVVHAFTGEFASALESFQQGLACSISPERQGQLRMFRALTLIKRLEDVPQARAEVEEGLRGMEGRQGPEVMLHSGWLRNVYALSYFKEKKLEPALQQEKLAIKCVGELHTPSATHLKINLISNVSVLQETARQYGDAIGTWRRFEKISANWGANFYKHHAYRLAGLQLQAGEREEAVPRYREAFANAENLGDVFHCQAIASELGRLHLDQGDRATAEGWYRRAVEEARKVGEPLRLAESLAGLSLSTGGTDWSEPLRLAGESSTWPQEARRLAQALSSGDAQAIRAVLPAPRTKLNRPFELINL